MFSMICGGMVNISLLSCTDAAINLTDNMTTQHFEQNHPRSRIQNLEI